MSSGVPMALHVLLRVFLPIARDVVKLLVHKIIQVLGRAHQCRLTPQLLETTTYVDHRL